jgi:histidine phosphotransferase ChpT
MDAGTDFRLIELLCSHLCHEVINPVTAVNNGLELLGQGDPASLGDAVALTCQSAASASRCLQFYRLAYGEAAGFEAVAGLATARQLAAGLFEGSKIGLDWPVGHPDPPLPVTKQSVKLLLNMIALAGEALPRGGTLSVRIGGGPGAVRAEVTAAGPTARLRDELCAAMAETAEAASLEPRTVQAYFTARLAETLRVGLALDQEEADIVRLSAGLVTAP